MFKKMINSRINKVQFDIDFKIQCIMWLTLPWVQEVFSRVRRGASFRRPQADTCSAEGRRHEQRSREEKLFARKKLFVRVTF